ncbi:hypothetical protein [Streptomyces sp. NPDC019224]|uniref:hypothetical protein n=1 Tax=Streptomyces sp. NPDC019224 TaxID=3154484 RepID=UPI0033ED34DB
MGREEPGRGRRTGGHVPDRVGQAPTDDGTALDKKCHVRADTDASLQRLVQDIEVTKTGQYGILWGTAELGGHLQAEVPDLCGTKTSRLDRGGRGQMGGVLEVDGLTGDLELGADQLPVFSIEPEFVGCVPQPRPTAEGVQKERAAFVHVRVLRYAYEEARKAKRGVRRSGLSVTNTVRSPTVILMVDASS